MTKFVNKRRYVDAVQWNQPGDHPDVYEADGLHFIDWEPFVQCAVYPGHWIVQVDEGRIQVLSDETFQKVYEPVKDPFILVKIVYTDGSSRHEMTTMTEDLLMIFQQELADRATKEDSIRSASIYLIDRKLFHMHKTFAADLEPANLLQAMKDWVEARK